MIDEVARRGYGREADAYERSRPSYPPDAVRWLVDQLQVRPGAVVADLAAGTGKLTRLLLPSGAFVLAIEPVNGMRQLFTRLLPTTPTIAGEAEAMPIKSSSLDAVCAAQAFHWFDVERAFVELARVLRPGGRLGLVWNTRDHSVDWVRRVWMIVEKMEQEAPWRDYDNWSDSALGEHRDFGPLYSATFRHDHVSTLAALVDRVRAVSHVAALAAREQDRVLADIRQLLATHPDTRGRNELCVPYRVDCYWTERL